MGCLSLSRLPLQSMLPSDKISILTLPLTWRKRFANPTGFFSARNVRALPAMSITARQYVIFQQCAASSIQWTVTPRANSLHNLSWVPILKHLLLILVAVFLIGCTGPLSMVKPTSTVQGQEVAKATIRVNSPFTFRPALWTATYPAGLYVPQFEDQDGVYFKAQDQILGQTIAGGRTVLGGLYVSKTSWSVYKAYVDEGGSIYKFDIPFPVDFTVLRQP